MTGSAAPNLAQLNFLNDVDVPAAYDIGFSSVNANTVGQATTGYYFDASQDFTVSMMYNFTLTDSDGLAVIGLGIGEDRAGVNSAGIALGVGNTSNSAETGFYTAAATNNDNPLLKLLGTPFFSDTYAGSLTVSYDAASGDITVGAGPVSFTPTPSPPTATATFSGSTELSSWTGDDLLVSFFLRSDTQPNLHAWKGESANADFFSFTVVEGSATQVPEPTSLALLALGGLAMMRRRRH